MFGAALGGGSGYRSPEKSQGHARETVLTVPGKGKGDVSGAGLFPYRVLVPVPGSCSGGADQEFGCGTICVGWGTLE